MRLVALSSPFVLLDDARAHGASPARLYTNPVSVITATAPREVAAALAAATAASAAGRHVAGYLAYEAGHALEPRLMPQARASALPLVWLGVFEDFEVIAAEEVPARLPSPAGAYANAPAPARTRAAYDAAFARVQAYIAAGDIYQANLTVPFSVKTAGHPLALYAGLRARAKAGYGGVIWTGTDWLLSLSPELFFAVQGGRVTTRPMKGTAARGHGLDDTASIASIQSDPKQRAENLMIVDLLRNDLSRVAEPGSVKTPSLFQVETYPTVHQMTSTVTATLRKDAGAVDIIKAVFPCGSITGAPKIRAMEVISEVEPHPRGPYTGSIGRIDPGGDAAFNVAIRTLHLAAGETTATLGLGGGIVADSAVGSEWAEMEAKGAFVADRRCFDLIETMRFDPASGIALLDRHIDRIGTSARALGFPFDRHGARNELQAATFRIDMPRRVRLLLSKSGRIAVEISALPSVPDAPVDVPIVPLTVDAHDFRLRHKTSDRAFYTAARGRWFEVALHDAEGFITEGSFTSIFVKRGGKLLTPPLARGLLPGVLREELIARDMAIEADLRAEDLAGGFFIGNACRGLLAARIATDAKS
ncbi:MAG: aminodeoxychorismate synthase component I [Sphingomonadaceae bacterium]